MAQRVLALVSAHEGDDDAALDRLTVALSLARRTGGQGYAYHWPIAWVLESLATISARARPADTRRWALALHDHAASTGMTDFVNRANTLLGTTAPTSTPN